MINDRDTAECRLIEPKTFINTKTSKYCREHENKNSLMVNIKRTHRHTHTKQWRKYPNRPEIFIENIIKY